MSEAKQVYVTLDKSTGSYMFAILNHGIKDSRIDAIHEDGRIERFDIYDLFRFHPYHGDLARKIALEHAHLFGGPYTVVDKLVWDDLINSSYL